MKFLSDTAADVSTEHITERDGELILDPKAPCGLAVECDFSGAFFSTQYIGDELTKFGFSAEFCAILREAKDQGFRYVRFHGLGAEVEGAPTFAW